MPGELQLARITGRSKHKPYSAASLILRQLIELYFNAPGSRTMVGIRKSVRPKISAARHHHRLPHRFLAVIDLLLMPNAGSGGGLIEDSELKSSVVILRNYLKTRCPARLVPSTLGRRVFTCGREVEGERCDAF